MVLEVDIRGMKNKILIIAISLLAAVGISLFKWWYFDVRPINVSITTDKIEYNSDGVLKVAIKNDSDKDVCFSSCYPYVLEKRDKTFRSYPYVACQKPDLNGYCVAPHQSKFFQINLPYSEGGSHRLVVSACVGCRINEVFRESRKLYSNEFNIH